MSISKNNNDELKILKHDEDVIKRRMIRYYKKLISGLLIVGGGFLLLEHLFTQEGFDVELLIGHEVYGLLLIGAGFLISLKWEQLPSFIKAVKNRDWEAILDEGKRKKKGI